MLYLVKYLFLLYQDIYNRRHAEIKGNLYYLITVENMVARIINCLYVEVEMQAIAGLCLAQVAFEDYSESLLRVWWSLMSRGRLGTRVVASLGT